MAKKTWTLIDVDSDQYLESLAVRPSLVGGTATGYAVTKRTLRGGRRDGVDVVEVDNGVFRFVLVPTRGMGLWKAALGQIQLGWQSPVKGPVHPSFVHLNEASGLGWLEGFDELMVRCGLESNGAVEFDEKGAVRYPLHGKIANTPAHKVELTVDGDAGQISVTGEVDEARLFGNKLRLTSTVTTRIGQPGLTIVDTVTNLSSEPGELELLYHTNFGLPLVSAGAKVVLPVAKMAPRDAVAVGNLDEWDVYGPETPGLTEVVFFFDLAAGEDGFTQALLHNATGDHGVSLKFNKNQLPCFTLWKNRQAAADGYVTGLEPALNFSNVKSFEKKQGRVALLAPGESRTFELAIEVHPNAASVVGAQQKIAALQKGVVPTIASQPDPQWSPV
jgi:galactose mutarotase-like enzyme